MLPKLRIMNIIRTAWAITQSTAELTEEALMNVYRLNLKSLVKDGAISSRSYEAKASSYYMYAENGSILSLINRKLSMIRRYARTEQEGLVIIHSAAQLRWSIEHRLT